MSQNPGWTRPPEGRVRPSLWWLTAAILAFLAGCVGAMLIAFSDGSADLSDRVDAFPRAKVPGTAAIDLAADRDYLVYLEFAGASTEIAHDDVTVTLTDPTGRPVSVGSLGSSTSYYQVDSREGRSIYGFHTDRAGTYRLTTAGTEGLTVAIGTDIASGLLKTVLLVFLSVGTGLVAAVVIVIVVIMRRERYRRRHLPGTSAPGPPGYQWY